MKTSMADTGAKQLKRRSATSSSSDWDNVTQEILKRCLGRLRAESASIFLMEECQERLRLVRTIGVRKNRHSNKTIRLGEGVSGGVAVKKEALLVEDLSNSTWAIPRKMRHGVDTMMSCPVMRNSSVLAVVNVAGNKTGRPFSPADLKTLEAMSGEFASALNQIIARRRPFPENLKVASAAQGELAILEKQLQALKKHNVCILRNLLQYVCIFDSQFEITCCSRENAFTGSDGRAESIGVPGQNVLDFPIDIERDELREKLKRLLREGEPFSLKNVSAKGCSELCVLNMSFSPFFSSDDRIVGGIVLIEDDTENYKMRRRLADAEKLSLLGSLTSMITHEINNPLDGVMRLINISMARIDENEPVKEYLNEAQKGVRRIASLVRSLLSFSRKSAAINSEFAHFNEVVDNAVSMIRLRKDRKDVRLHLELPPDSPVVRTNDFYQIINNLLSNAYDAFPRGGGNVELRTQSENGDLSLIVKDDGIGIPERAQSRVFKTFWTTKKDGKGTGLGLAIVKKLVEKYDGTIDLQSEENVGTRIQLKFPLDKLSG